MIPSVGIVIIVNRLSSLEKLAFLTPPVGFAWKKPCSHLPAANELEIELT
jgi:hypothetical protein